MVTFLVCRLWLPSSAGLALLPPELQGRVVLVGTHVLLREGLLGVHCFHRNSRDGLSLLVPMFCLVKARPPGLSLRMEAVLFIH